MGAIVYRNNSGMLMVLKLGRYDELDGPILTTYQAVMGDGEVVLLNINDEMYQTLLKDPLSCSDELSRMI